MINVSEQPCLTVFLFSHGLGGSSPSDPVAESDCCFELSAKGLNQVKTLILGKPDGDGLCLAEALRSLPEGVVRERTVLL